MRAVYSILFLVLSFAAHAEKIDPQHELLAVARADDPGHPTEVIGKKDLLTRRGSPASTIKVALALMALQEKVIDLKSSHLCSDRTPVPSPLTLQQAMDLSSNDFFEQLVINLSIPRLKTYLDRWKCFPLLPEKIPPSPFRIARGKAFMVSSMDQLVFLSRLAQHRVEGVSQPAYDLLDQVLALAERPGLFGKTGSDGEGAWFVAYSRDPAAPLVFVLRSDIPNSDGKRLKKILLDHLEKNAAAKAQDQ